MREFSDGHQLYLVNSYNYISQLFLSKTTVITDFNWASQNDKCMVMTTSLTTINVFNYT